MEVVGWGKTHRAVAGCRMVVAAVEETVGTSFRFLHPISPNHPLDAVWLPIPFLSPLFPPSPLEQSFSSFESSSMKFSLEGGSL